MLTILQPCHKYTNRLNIGEIIIADAWSLKSCGRTTCVWIAGTVIMLIDIGITKSSFASGWPTYKIMWIVFISFSILSSIFWVYYFIHERNIPQLKMGPVRISKNKNKQTNPVPNAKQRTKANK